MSQICKAEGTCHANQIHNASNLWRQGNQTVKSLNIDLKIK